MFKLFNSLPNDKILVWSKLKAFADDKINLTLIEEMWLWKSWKHCANRRNCWKMLLFPVFSEGFFVGVVKKTGLGKGLNILVIVWSLIYTVFNSDKNWNCKISNFFNNLECVACKCFNLVKSKMLLLGKGLIRYM